MITPRAGGIYSLLLGEVGMFGPDEGAWHPLTTEVRVTVRRGRRLRTLPFLLLPVWLIACGAEDVSVGHALEPRLVWNDEFDGEHLDDDKWVLETGAHGWGNNEWQDYTARQNTEVSGGTLKIIARRSGAGQNVGDYTSARLNSIQSFTYGRMEVRAKVPELRGNGLWPAIWMLGRNIDEVGWPACGEIDIMEYVSHDPNTFHYSVHTTAFNHIEGSQVTSGGISLATIEERFHVYGVIWTEDFLKFYLDDTTNVMLTFEKPANATRAEWPFDGPQYFLLNMAVGGNWGGAQGVDDEIFPATFEIDYVRVYER